MSFSSLFASLFFVFVLVSCSFSCYVYPMTIEQTVTIPADHRLHLDFDLPAGNPAGKARAALTQIYEDEQERTAAGKWANPLLGLAKAKGASLTLERFLETQQEEIERENENDKRLWVNR
jgi:hypothetical protein